jgi:hypothetical protein
VLLPGRDAPDEVGFHRPQALVATLECVVETGRGTIGFENVQLDAHERQGLRETEWIRHRCRHVIVVELIEGDRSDEVEVFLTPPRELRKGAVGFDGHRSQESCDGFPDRIRRTVIGDSAHQPHNRRSQV